MKQSNSLRNVTHSLSQYIRGISKSTLTPSTKDLLRDVVNLRVFSPSLSDHLLLILGTQRSGTTLSLLMLQAHPNIIGLYSVVPYLVSEFMYGKAVGQPPQAKP